MTVATFLTDHDPEISSFDAFYHNTMVKYGWSHYLTNSSSNWGSGVDTALTSDVTIRTYSTSSKWEYARVGIIGFDISSIPHGSTVNSVILRIKFGSVVNTLGISPPSSDLVIRKANPDYINHSSSNDVPSFSSAITRIGYSTIISGAWKDIDLGGAGIQYISDKLGGSVFFGIDSGMRYDSAPEPPHSANQTFSISIMSADYTNSHPGNDVTPRLIIDYTPPHGVFTQAIIIS